MSEKKEVIWKHLGDIKPVVTSHRVGDKRVIASQVEIGKPVTQIAHIVLHAHEYVEKHIHPTMDEHFFILEGSCVVIIEGCCYPCKGGDYLFVPTKRSHEINVKENTTMITIGIETNTTK